MDHMKLMEVVYRGPAYLPEPGDIFAYRIRDVYRFCRVIRDVTQPNSSVHVLLTYFYSPTSNSLEEIPKLDATALVIPPLRVESLAWAYGLFVRVRRQTLEPADVLPVHCFFKRIGDSIRHCDEMGRPFAFEFEPCGVFGISFVWSIEQDVALATGIIQQMVDYGNLPDLPDSPYVRRRGKTQVLILGLPQAALDTQGLEHGQVEDQLTEAIEPRLGEWIESGFNLTTRTREILFEVSPAKARKTADVIHKILGALGLSDYTLEIEGSAEKL